MEYAWTKQTERYLDFLKAHERQAGLLDASYIEAIIRLQRIDGRTSAQEMLDIFHRAQRLVLLTLAGQQNNHELLSQIRRFCPQSWMDIEGAPASLSQQKKVGDQLMAGISLTEGDRVGIEATPRGKAVVEHMVEQCAQRGIPFDVMIPDQAFTRLVLNACTPEQAYAYGKEHWAIFTRDPQAKYLAVRREYASDVEEVIDTETIGEKYKAFSVAKGEARDVHKGTYCLTYIPTPEEAEIDGMEYSEYLELFFQLCNQPWKQIQDAQVNLIQAFNRCEGFRAENGDGTNVRMSIKGFTFANSVVARNLPGSEIFSAPERESVNGTVVAKGKFRLDGVAGIIEDMTLEFKDGKVVDYDARVNKEGLGQYLDRDPGNRYVGELGIGTNPWLKQHVANGLLVEKIGGSFHLALGSSYKNGYLDDESVIMNNGNTSNDHQDLTTMLQGKQGKMFLTDELGVEHLVQDDGQWLAVPALGITQESADILNKGWQAVREQEGDARVPAEWIKILDAQTSKAAGRQ